MFCSWEFWVSSIYPLSIWLVWKVTPETMCQLLLMLSHLTHYYYYYTQIVNLTAHNVTCKKNFSCPSCYTYHFDAQWAIFQWRTESLKQHRHLIWTKLAYVIFKRAENFTGKKERYINSSPLIVSVVGWYLISYKKDTERGSMLNYRLILFT